MEAPDIRVYRLSGKRSKIEFEDDRPKILHVFSTNGQLAIDPVQGHKEAFVQVDRPGIYIVRVQEKDRTYSFKLPF
jgi:hypothetical protein